eukprot:5418852-Ditylum_brightwellii.AAC.1
MREKYWRHWQQYAKRWNKDSFLDNASELKQGIIITAFAARVRTGIYSRGHQVSVSSITGALSTISKTIQLAQKHSPVYREDQKYILPVEKCVKGIQRQDPLSIPQLAVPVSVPIECHRMAYAAKNIGVQAAADLALVAFYFLLRVGEYMLPHKVKQNGVWKQATCTVQLRISNVGFYKVSKLLERNAPITKLLQADAATLKISNKKWQDGPNNPPSSH